MRVPGVVITFATVVGFATILAIYTERLSLAAAMDIGLLLASLTWLFFLVKIPWDLYFTARKARSDGQESQRLGIEGVEGKTRLLRTMERFLLIGALGGHALTAVGVYALGSFRPDLVSREFGWLFVASAALRPAWEGYGYLRQRVRELASEVRYPREDVTTLGARVSDLRSSQKDLQHQLAKARRELNTRLQQLEVSTHQLQSQQIAESARLEKQTVRLSHRFEEVVEKMSSDQDLLAGVRAFARMLREGPPT